MNIEDKDILFSIAKKINNPKTWINFSLACKKTREICLKLKKYKINQFLIKKNKKKCCDDPDNAGNRLWFSYKWKELPNGEKHGYLHIKPLNSTKPSNYYEKYIYFHFNKKKFEKIYEFRPKPEYQGYQGFVSYDNTNTRLEITYRPMNKFTRYCFGDFIGLPDE